METQLDKNGKDIQLVLATVLIIKEVKTTPPTSCKNGFCLGFRPSLILRNTLE